jgi:hypothetical protein
MPNDIAFRDDADNLLITINHHHSANAAFGKNSRLNHQADNWHVL